MISFTEAKEIVLNTNTIQAVEPVDFQNSIGRVLGQDISSDINFPPFDKAAMDGFAIRENEIDQELEIIETIAAGQSPSKKVNSGQAARIMTGAPMPEGADFVIQVELSELVNENTVRFSKKPKNNTIYKASQTKIGETVLRKGQIIDARHIAIMASVGCTKPLVYKKLKVGVISTGDEIVEPNYVPGNSQIRNSNGHQLVAQILQCNAEPIYLGIAKDEISETKQIIRKGLDTCDILILTGGVSMGEFDFVPEVLKDLGVDILFDRVAIKPGKPTTYGRIGNKHIFGLPGNPISSYIQFDNFVKPLLFKIVGAKNIQNYTTLTLAETYTRKSVDRVSHIPVKIEHNKIYFSDYKGSSHIHALSESDGLIEIAKGESMIKKGELINVRLF